MRIFLYFLIFISFILPKQSFSKNIKIFIPLYSCPSDNNGKIWESVIEASKKIDIIISWGIICKSDNYIQILKKMGKFNIIRLAYIATNNSSKSFEHIKKNIKFYNKFPIDGFFFDEISNESNALEYNEKIINLAKKSSKDFFVFLNSPYASPDFVKNSSADAVIIFENSFKEWKNFNLKNYNNKAIAIIHHTPELYIDKIIKKAIKNNLMALFITNRGYDTLPTYFNKEIELMSH